MMANRDSQGESSRKTTAAQTITPSYHYHEFEIELGALSSLSRRTTSRCLIAVVSVRRCDAVIDLAAKSICALN